MSYCPRCSCIGCEWWWQRRASLDWAIAAIGASFAEGLLDLPDVERLVPDGYRIGGLRKTLIRAAERVEQRAREYEELPVSPAVHNRAALEYMRDCCVELTRGGAPWVL